MNNNDENKEIDGFIPQRDYGKGKPKDFTTKASRKLIEQNLNPNPEFLPAYKSEIEFKKKIKDIEKKMDKASKEVEAYIAVKEQEKKDFTLSLDDDVPINENQKQFCLTWLKNGQNTTSAYLAVYKNVKLTTAESYGCTLLKAPKIQLFLRPYLDAIRERQSINLEENIETLKRTVKSCETNGDSMGLLRALDILNRIGGFYKITPQIQINQDLNVSFGGWNPDEEALKNNKAEPQDFTDITDISSEPE
jgi:hypothetical protein